MRDGWFKLASGRDVFLEQFHVRKSALEFLEGSPDTIRAEVLRRLPQQVRASFGFTGLLLHEPPCGSLPAYTFFASLVSNEPVHPGADFSRLVLCWFGDSLPESVRGSVASQLETLEWDRYAKDGQV
jgi:hypothetical protein